MANLCSPVFWFNFKSGNTAKKFNDLLTKADALTKYHGFSNILAVCGYPYHIDSEGYVRLKKEPDFNYAGSITDHFLDNRKVIVEASCNWAPITGPFATALEYIGVPFKDGKFEEIEVAYYGEERGCNIFTASDTDFAEGDSFIRFSVESEKKLPDSVDKIFASENSDGDDHSYESCFNGYKNKILGEVAKTIHADPDDKNLIEKYEMSLSDGTARLFIRLPGLEALSRNPRLIPDIVKMLQWLAPGRTGTFCETGSIKFDFTVNIDDMIRQMQKHLDPKIRTLREGAEILESRFNNEIDINVIYDASLSVTDIDICDWLEWAEGWTPKTKA